ncbi:MAG TPA: glycosyltransferase, partial [Alphaproteobacteria bacterium]|nr:glycosyltransferase [Alphaproteobacteria bacterium]
RRLHERKLEHRLLLYYDDIHLSFYAHHPIDIFTLNPEPQVMHKVGMLQAYFDDLPKDMPRPLMSGIQPALHASLAGIKGFHTLMHDTPSLLGDGPGTIRDRIRQMVANRTLRRGLNSGGTTIVTSEYTAAESRKLWQPPVAIAYLGGLPAKSFRPRVPGTTFRLLSVSRVEANKRIDWLLSGLAGLEKRRPRLSQRIDWILDVVGGGSMIDRLTEMARVLGLADRVAFHNFIDDQHLEAFYDHADLFLMPARQGYGIPAVEALSRGIPVLVHRQSGISDILLDTPWATVMEGGEETITETLGRAIQSVLSQSHLKAPLPDLPTEDSWAEQVARICGWVP